jgi:hypothetical protein
MKRDQNQKPLKLRVSASTIRTLSNVQLHGVAGGSALGTCSADTKCFHTCTDPIMGPGGA